MARKNCKAGPRFHEDPRLPEGKQDITLYPVFAAPRHTPLTAQPAQAKPARVRTRRTITGRG